MEITTTIIIPNYNGLKFMDECIRSLNAQTYPNFRTLVVDNGSTDGSVEWLKEHQIDTIFLPETTGFSGAVNVGIKAADTPYVLLLNNDVRVDEYFVAEMVRAIGQSERIFSVSSRMIQMYHPDRLDDAGNYYCALGWAYARGKGKDIHTYEKEEKIFASCAGAAIYRKKIFDELGYFDEDVSFPAIYEGNMPWVSACPSEINSMSGSLSEVSGKVLVLGLGLGYYPFIASQKSNVREITIVEINSGIIDIFTRYVLPQFPMKQKIKIVCADAIKYMASVKKGEYDYCFADIWEGAEDGADRYIAIKKYEAQLHGTKFSYWIEDEIKRYLGDEI